LTLFDNLEVGSLGTTFETARSVGSLNIFPILKEKQTAV
jgi:hypothetical protein